MTRTRISASKHTQRQKKVEEWKTTIGDLAVNFVYNTTAYDAYKKYDTERRDDKEPYSGWCTFEQGVSMMAVAYLQAAKKEKKGLHKRFKKAEESGRPS